MTTFAARQALHELVQMLKHAGLPDFVWAIEHAPDGDLNAAVARLWEAAGPCSERAEVARALAPLAQSQAHADALCDYASESFCCAYEGMETLTADLSRDGRPSAAWTRRFAPDGDAQAALATLWMSASHPAPLRKLLVLIDPVRAAANPSEWNTNYGLPDEEAREILLHYQRDVPTLPDHVSLTICERCRGEGEVPGDCGAGVACWDCGGTCLWCQGKGAKTR